MAFLDNLSESQREAVVYNDGPHLIIAGAGSGKTRVLTFKIAYLLSQGVSAGNILALTFTNKAAREMRERIGKLVFTSEVNKLWMGTFHSVFARILRKEADKLGYDTNYSIYDTTDSKALIKSIIEGLDISKEEEKLYRVGEILNRISDAKTSLISPESYAVDKGRIDKDELSGMPLIYKIYKEYDTQLLQANAMDFDDLLLNMYLLLYRFPDSRAYYQHVFRHVLIDEYQDTNHLQYAIVKLLAGPETHICAVGDDAQSIYSFRGADIRNILDFQRDFAGCRLFKLERNYRSTKNIVGAANSVIKHNRQQISKDVYSEKEDGLPIQISYYLRDTDEAEAIAEKIYILHKQGRSYNDIAVLYRSNAQSSRFETALGTSSIPYRIYGGEAFWKRAAVKDILAILRLISNTKDNEAFKRTIKAMDTHIGATSLKKISVAAVDNGVCMFDVAQSPSIYNLKVQRNTLLALADFCMFVKTCQKEIDNLGAYDFTCFVLEKAGIQTENIRPRDTAEINRIEEIRVLKNNIKEFEQKRLESEYVDVVDIRAFLANAALLTDQDKQAKDEEPHVTLTTVHAAKGLEFKVVIIAGMENMLFPSPFSYPPFEEERRLFYVALTRAQEECYITYAKQRMINGKTMQQEASLFIKDLDPRFISRSQENIRKSNWSHMGFESDRATSSRRVTEPMSFQALTSHQTTERQPAPTRPKNLKKLSPSQAGTHTSQACSFPIGTRVRHNLFGDGTVIGTESQIGNDCILVKFDENGTRKILLNYAKIERI